MPRWLARWDRAFTLLSDRGRLGVLALGFLIVAATASYVVGATTMILISRRENQVAQIITIEPTPQVVYEPTVAVAPTPPPPPPTAAPLPGALPRVIVAQATPVPPPPVTPLPQTSRGFAPQTGPVGPAVPERPRLVATAEPTQPLFRPATTLVPTPVAGTPAPTRPGSIVAPTRPAVITSVATPAGQPVTGPTRPAATTAPAAKPTSPPLFSNPTPPRATAAPPAPTVRPAGTPAR